MNRYLAYLKQVVRHKVFVYQEGRKLGLWPLRLILHDWDKFLPGMISAYAHYYNEADGSRRTSERSPAEQYAMDYWWNHHQKINRHHWQHWYLINDTDGEKALEIPYVDMVEMLADWRGASKAYGGDVQQWYIKTVEGRKLHWKTRNWIEAQIGILRYGDFVTTDPARIQALKDMGVSMTKIVERMIIVGDPNK